MDFECLGEETKRMVCMIYKDGSMTICDDLDDAIEDAANEDELKERFCSSMENLSSEASTWASQLKETIEKKVLPELYR